MTISGERTEQLDIFNISSCIDSRLQLNVASHPEYTTCLEAASSSSRRPCVYVHQYRFNEYGRVRFCYILSCYLSL